MSMARSSSGRKPTFLLQALKGEGRRSEIARWQVRRAVGAPFGAGWSMAVDIEAVRAMAERVARSEGLFLVDIELKGGRSNPLLRVYIDKEGGISHADCQLVSEQLSVLLDVEDPFPGSYTLEVSSPGLDRELRRLSEFEHFTGRRARLILRPPVEGPGVLEGRLAGCEAGRVRLDLGADGIREFDLSAISKAKLLVDF